jgi:hypothetical protein
MEADVYCAELELSRGFYKLFFLRPRDEKAVGAASVVGVFAEIIT